MESKRCLILMGNQKLGTSIGHFDLMPVETCPGRTSICTRVCYARSGRFVFPKVLEKLRWNYQQSLREDFVARLVKEIRSKGMLVIRQHVSGDFYDEFYARKWLAVIKQCPRVRFYAYTRSFVIPEIASVLEEMAALRCMKLWYSVDNESGIPKRIPPGVKLAYLQTQKDEKPDLIDLIFRVRRLRRQRLSLALVCPAEVPNAHDVTCGSCQKCFR
ncbi:hypothetical protein BH10PLA2_BH10PLA2_27440 [soil metagenome]